MKNENNESDYSKAWSERALQFAIDQKIATNNELTNRFKRTYITRVKALMLPILLKHPRLLGIAKKAYNKLI